MNGPSGKMLRGFDGNSQKSLVSALLYLSRNCMTAYEVSFCDL